MNELERVKQSPFCTKTVSDAYNLGNELWCVKVGGGWFIVNSIGEDVQATRIAKRVALKPTVVPYTRVEEVPIGSSVYLKNNTNERTSWKIVSAYYKNKSVIVQCKANYVETGAPYDWEKTPEELCRDFIFVNSNLGVGRKV